MCSGIRRGAALTLAGAVLVLGVRTARGQLTAEDIASLREQGQREGWTFTVQENEATRRSPQELYGVVEPPDWRQHARFDPSVPRRDLPPAFDWRNVGGVNYCTPIRDQGGCGSCWAFGAMGSVECAILITDGESRNLSEQWLLSCTRAGNCTTGGWHMDAYEFLRCNGRTDPCGDFGAVLENDFPYYANSDVQCACPYDHPYCLDSWAVVGPEWGIASVEQIKQAILDHGPVSTCIAANSAFSGYRGGIFNACTRDLPINHVVVLVGWDDNQGPNGVWFLRNSWGASWGEAGYMRIVYGCALVGYATCYVDYTRPDCNGNGVRDADDIASGYSQDCNRNGIPDDCDVGSHTSRDCNGNGVPDECDVAWPLPALSCDVPPVLDWIEISATGTPLNLWDNGVVGIRIPFTNGFYRTDAVQIGNNGALAFGGASDLPFLNEPVPCGNLFGGALALVPLWDDLAAQTGDVYWQVIGQAPQRALIVEWYNRPHAPGDAVLNGNEVTFEVQAFEATAGGVLAQYLYADTDFRNPAYDDGASATVGFQIDGGRGQQWSYNQIAALYPGLVLSVVADGVPGSTDANHDGVPDECEIVGDLNCDGSVNLKDINPFVVYLADLSAWQGLFPDCPPPNGDINGDGTWPSFKDINPFVVLLSRDG